MKKLALIALGTSVALNTVHLAMAESDTQNVQTKEIQPNITNQEKNTDASSTSTEKKQKTDGITGQCAAGKCAPGKCGPATSAG